MMRKFLYATIPLLFAIPLQASFLDWFAAPSPAAKEAETLLEKIDALVEQARQEYEVPGIAIGVVVDGQVVCLKGFGVRDLETKEPVTQDTAFRIGSCTKAFTSFVMGTLIDQGLMSWSEPVFDVLPNFRLYDQHATQNLTFLDLLTHRSGVSRHDFMWYNSSISREEAMRRLRYLVPSSNIRERYHYNNLMYLPVGYAMEQLTKKSWEELVSERILKPLEMTHTTFSPEEMQSRSNFATPYVERGGALKKMSFRNMDPIAPAAVINSSVSDLVKWITMLLDGGQYKGETLISRGVLQEMMSAHTVMNETPDTSEMQHCYCGIGWRICSYRGQTMVHHDGGPDGYVAQIALLPRSRVGVVVLANKNLTPLPLVMTLHILDTLAGFPPINWVEEGKDRLRKMSEGAILEKRRMEKQRHLNTTPSHTLKEYTGEYTHPGYGKITINLEGDDRLSATFNGITSFLDHWHYDVFCVAEESDYLILDRAGMKYTFRTNVQGEIEELIIPFEAGAGDIVFQKAVNDRFTERSYLSQFTGYYEINGHTVEVLLRGDQLSAAVPGQPPYYLVPISENLFSVQSHPGYSVSFLMGEYGEVEGVSLGLPYWSIPGKPIR